MLTHRYLIDNEQQAYQAAVQAKRSLQGTTTVVDTANPVPTGTTN